jgi:hypothetical protein
LDSIIENYSRAQQKASPIKQINNLRKKYAHNKEALTEIETAYGKALTGLAASYEKSLQERDERERKAILQKWSKDKKAIAKEVARVAKNLRSQNRYLAALELETGLSSLQSGTPLVDEEKQYRDQLHTVMDNLDYGVYQDGEENTAQKIFWNIQQLVQDANTYLLLNTIPNSGATYTGLRSTIEDLLVRLQMNDHNKIQNTLDKLKIMAQGIDNIIKDTIGRCDELQKKEILLIDANKFTNDANKFTNDANKFTNARTILERAPRFADVVKKISVRININVNGLSKYSNENQWLGKDGLVELIQSKANTAQFEAHYNKINGTSNDGYAEKAFAMGQNLPTTFDAILWRHIPPCSTRKDIFPQDFINDLQKPFKQLEKKTLHAASQELQVLVARAHAVKESLEQKKVAPDQINLALYSWRKEINQKLTALQWATLELHSFFEQQVKVITDELFFASLLADNEIIALPSSNEASLTQAIKEGLTCTPDTKIFDELDALDTADKALNTEALAAVKQAYDQAGIPAGKPFDKLSQEELQRFTEQLTQICDPQGTLKTLFGDIDTFMKNLRQGLEKFYDAVKTPESGLANPVVAKSSYRSKYSPPPAPRGSDVSRYRYAYPASTTGSSRYASPDESEREESSSRYSSRRERSDSSSDDEFSWGKRAKWLLVTTVIIVILVICITHPVIGGIIIGVLLTVGVVKLEYTKKIWKWIRTAFSPPTNDETPINPFTTHYYLAGAFMQEYPEFVILLELSTIMNKILFANKCKIDQSEQADKILEIAHNNAWYHLTVIDKAIDIIRARKTEKTTKAAALMRTQIQAIRERLKVYFNQQLKPAQAAPQQ